MKKLLSICCTFRRPDMLMDMLASWDETRSQLADMVIYLHLDDPFINKYIDNLRRTDYHFVLGKHATIPEITDIFCKNKEYDYFQLVNDDHLYKTQNWDRLMIAAFEKQSNGWGFCCGRDLINNNDWHKHENPSAEIWSRKQYEAVGYAYPRNMDYQQLDLYAKDLAKSVGGLVFVPDVVIQHLWYGGCDKEPDINIKEKYTDENMNRANAAYQWWVDNKRSEAVNKILEAIKNGR